MTNALIEPVARALCRVRIMSNIRFEPHKANDPKFVQRCEDASWNSNEWIDLAKAALAVCAVAAPAGSRRVRHKARGSTYQVLGEAEAQVSVSDGIVINTIGMMNGRIVTEGSKLTVYRSDADGSLWLRFPDEFEDGRFEDLP